MFITDNASLTFSSLSFSECTADSGRMFYLSTTVVGYFEDQMDTWNDLVGTNSITQNDMVVEDDGCAFDLRQAVIAQTILHNKYIDEKF